jgi:hypothetical protein
MYRGKDDVFLGQALPSGQEASKESVDYAIQKHISQSMLSFMREKELLFLGCRRENSQPLLHPQVLVVYFARFRSTQKRFLLIIN